MCITEGHDVRQAVTMRNKYNQLVGGVRVALAGSKVYQGLTQTTRTSWSCVLQITPLFLAAQKGHMKV
jgi:phage terminase large subunit-like protein